MINSLIEAGLAIANALLDGVKALTDAARRTFLRLEEAFEAAEAALQDVLDEIEAAREDERERLDAIQAVVSFSLSLSFPAFVCREGVVNVGLHCRLILSTDRTRANRQSVQAFL